MNAHSDKNTSKLLSALLLLLVIAFTALLIFLTYQAPIVRKQFFARSINDASYDCEDKISGRYKGQLVHKQYDNLSSHYEPDKHIYAIFYRISVKEQMRNQQYPTVKEYMVKCLVWEKLGYVSEFSVFET